MVWSKVRDISLIFHLQELHCSVYITSLSLNTCYSSLKGVIYLLPDIYLLTLRSLRAPSIPSYFSFADIGTQLTSLPRQKGLDVVPSSIIQCCCWLNTKHALLLSLLHKLCFLSLHCSSEFAVQRLFNENISQKKKNYLLST